MEVTIRIKVTLKGYLLLKSGWRSHDKSVNGHILIDFNKSNWRTEEQPVLLLFDFI